MKLYLIHCGFYDEDIMDGVYEFHLNIPVVAANVDEAKTKVRLHADFKRKKMHIDGLQELNVIDGFELVLQVKADRRRENDIASILHRDF